MKSGQTTTPAEPEEEEADHRRDTGTVDLIALLKKSLGQKGAKLANVANDDKRADDAGSKVRKAATPKRKGSGSRRAA